MQVLVVNAGSSSLKLSLLGAGDQLLASHELEAPRAVVDPGRLEAALSEMAEVDAIGHRIVHGGSRYTEAVRIDDGVVAGLRDLSELAPLGDWSQHASPADRVILLPSTEQGPLLPPWLLPDIEAAEEAEPRLTPWKVPGLALEPVRVLDLLVRLPLDAGGERWWGADLRYWGLVAKLGLELLARQKYLPGMAEEEGHYRALWLPVLDEPHDRSRLRALAQAMPAVCRGVFTQDETPDPADGRIRRWT